MPHYIISFYASENKWGIYKTGAPKLWETDRPVFTNYWFAYSLLMRMQHLDFRQGLLFFAEEKQKGQQCTIVKTVPEKTDGHSTGS
jgi:hypothetical protein